MIPQFSFLLESLPAGRVFALDSQVLISIAIQLFNAGLLAFVLTIILYRPVQDFMHRRTERIKAYIGQVEEEKAQVAALKLQYEKKLNEIDLERDAIIIEARQMVSDKTRQMLSQAKEEADAMRTRAETEAQLEYSRVQDDMKRSIIESSSAIAIRVVENVIDQSEHDRLIHRILTELEEKEWPT